MLSFIVCIVALLAMSSGQWSRPGDNLHGRRHRHHHEYDPYQADAMKLEIASKTLRGMVDGVSDPVLKEKMESEAINIEKTHVGKAVARVLDNYTHNGTLLPFMEKVSVLEKKLDTAITKLDRLIDISLDMRSQKDYMLNDIRKINERIESIAESVSDLEKIKRSDEPIVQPTVGPAPPPASRTRPRRPLAPALVPNFPSGNDFGSHLSVNIGPMSASIPGVGDYDHGSVRYVSSLGRNHDGYINQKTQEDQDLVDQMYHQVIPKPGQN